MKMLFNKYRISHYEGKMVSWICYCYKAENIFPGLFCHIILTLVPGYTYMYPSARSILVQVMVYLYAADPFLESKSIYCEVDLDGYTLVQFYSYMKV